MNNNLLTLYQMINNANITISQFATTVQTLMLSVTNSDILTNKVISSVLLQEFLFRIPYDQNLNTFQIRFSGIVNKYAINIVNYCIKLEQLNNFFLMLKNNQSKSVNYTTNLISDITTTNDTNTVSADAFNPVDNSLVTINLAKAASATDVTADGVSTASSSNSNFDTTQNQKQDTTHNMSEKDLAIFNTLKFDMDNLLQPVLTALNSLFYIFDTNGENFIW